MKELRIEPEPPKSAYSTPRILETYSREDLDEQIRPPDPEAVDHRRWACGCDAH